MPQPDNSLQPIDPQRAPAGRDGHGDRPQLPPPQGIHQTGVPSFIGRGFAFPMGVGPDGSIRLTTGSEDLDASMRVVLSTAPGERLMRPQFGCRIWELLFEPVNHNTLGMIADAVREALAQWEPRADVTDVDCIQDNRDANLVNVHITYKIRTTNDRRNLVYPFYVIPREDT